MSYQANICFIVFIIVSWGTRMTGFSHSNHVVRARSQQLGNAGVQFIPIALHEPLGIVLDSVVVMVHSELPQPRVGRQVLLVCDLRG